MVDNEVVFDGLSRAWALGSCFFLAISYILVFYIKKSPYHRDHFETIKLRCIRATGFCFIGPIFVFLLSQQSPNGAPIWQWLGIHYENIIKAAVLPLLLTMVLFIGPITMMFLAEELPFMSAHFHHAIERLQAKENVLNVCIGTLFQFSYTTLFGIYSAFVFIRTGHLIGPFICHSFCNYMGIPEFEKIPDTKYPKAVAAMFIIGLLLFTSLLKPLTEPTLYNSVYFR
ncbi:CAAX prenyl protease 2-like isoform X2 [Dendronephthya gigantea]|uniref:CAAX prenyl protease 2-like isoform X2 n=1 Tax=Dendronephthya gigantea TaxID=151771 RepID=UPI00106BF6C6|nr:CAAX prenyl protease 2-like isoform X2 [Dendronephthya gigantea]